jgi:hypothetical protein
MFYVAQQNLNPEFIRGLRNQRPLRAFVYSPRLCRGLPARGPLFVIAKFSRLRRLKQLSLKDTAILHFTLLSAVVFLDEGGLIFELK